MGASVVVTGANRGIGLATALELASAGYDVIGTARSADKARELLEAAGVRGLALRSVLLDVADAASSERGFAEIAELTGGGPWAVVNNAGYAQAGAIEDVGDAALRYQLEVNLVAPARIARLVLPAMRQRGEGRIVNMSSIAGRVSLPLLGWYCAAKHGLEAMTDALRMEVAQYGIQVVLIEPGSFGTGIWAGARYPDAAATGDYAAAYCRARAATARLARFMPGPWLVARAVRHALASPRPLARYLVGLDAAGGVVAETLAPTAVSDRAKEVVAGVRRSHGPAGGPAGSA
ncbi:MAG TPA: SDR family oxidoreductase [Actinomycetota bacterium]|jgi:NAD(P)-dependent dehydrogenase (short-subunit alcohol dehydrogenase family)|nr:SDR family oxidoreductase [Actinomycetota bacterium]